MKFFDRIKSTFEPSEEELQIRREVEELIKLHPDFNRAYGQWVGNRKYFGMHGASLKIRFAFGDPSLLSDCWAPVKIGVNLDRNIPERYIGFAYGGTKTRDQLIEWAKRFPYSELIEGLDGSSVITKNSKVTVLKPVEALQSSENSVQSESDSEDEEPSSFNG